MRDDDHHGSNASATHKSRESDRYRGSGMTGSASGDRERARERDRPREREPARRQSRDRPSAGTAATSTSRDRNSNAAIDKVSKSTRDSGRRDVDRDRKRSASPFASRSGGRQRSPIASRYRRPSMHLSKSNSLEFRHLLFRPNVPFYSVVLYVSIYLFQ